MGSFTTLDLTAGVTHDGQLGWVTAKVYLTML